MSSLHEDYSEAEHMTDQTTLYQEKMTRGGGRGFGNEGVKLTLKKERVRERCWFKFGFVLIIQIYLNFL